MIKNIKLTIGLVILFLTSVFTINAQNLGIIAAKINPDNGHTYALLSGPRGDGYYYNSEYAQAKLDAKAIGGHLITFEDHPTNLDPYPHEFLWVQDNFIIKYGGAFFTGTGARKYVDPNGATYFMWWDYWNKQFNRFAYDDSYWNYNSDTIYPQYKDTVLTVIKMKPFYRSRSWKARLYYTRVKHLPTFQHRVLVEIENPLM